MSLQGKTALITGGTKGIGKAVAVGLLDAGMNVCITGRTQEVLDETKHELQARYGDALMTAACDVRDYQGQAELVNRVSAKYGKLDILIANAGVGHFSAIDQMTVEQWNDTIDINLTGVFNSVKASVEQLKKNKGYIITIASLAGTNFFAKGSAYNASKFGLVGFSQAIMMDLREYGVKVTTIMPGSVSTHFNGNDPSSKDAWKIQPEDISQMVVDLLNMNPRTLPSKVEVRPSMPPSQS